MSAHSTRRAALGAILATPLASMLATARAAVPGVSPELARLIRKSRVANERVNVEIHEPGYPYGSVRAAAALRCRVARFKPAGMADVLAKARHTVAIWGRECAEGEFEDATAEGGAYLDDMAHAVLLDLVRLVGEDAPCA
ncbi:MAG: hypothetical protein WAP03_13775 [Methylorubrum rhodinum]|uniref:hypothetical protein n=1 Tax=Methylorubrum rhodinum TaxID=29428 RepID=UPI003BAE2D9E